MLYKSIKIALFVSFLISISCTTKLVDEIIPTQKIAGTWRFRSATGTATVGSNSLDLTDDLSINDGGNTYTHSRTSTWVFNEDGTGTQDGENITYVVTGNFLTITKNTKKFTVNVTLKDGELEIKEDETGLKTIVDELNLQLTSAKITKYSRTLKYRLLQDIINTNGSPECLVLSYTNINESTKRDYKYTYNDENTISEEIINTLRLSDSTISEVKLVYLENRARLGSEDKPFVTILRNNQLFSKVFCDLNARVTRREYFATGYYTYPAEADFEEYDSNGNNVKTVKKFYDVTNGELLPDRFIIYEAEYADGNYTKLYYTDQSTARYLTNEFTTWTFNTVKTKFVYAYNYGNLSFGGNNKNHRSKLVFRDESGNITGQSSMVYTFNGAGYMLSNEETFTGSNIRRVNSDYVYRCK